MKEKDYCYMVISTKDDLPLGVFDTFRETLKFLGCSSYTLGNMLRFGMVYRDMIVEKVLL